jgi:hypothetical protein
MCWWFSIIHGNKKKLMDEIKDVIASLRALDMDENNYRV